MAVLSDVLDLYAADRLHRGIAKGTRRNEMQVLRLLLADVGNIQTKSLRVQHVDIFWSRRGGWAPGTQNRARHSLSTFFKWCQARGHIERGLDLLEGSRKVKVPPRNRVIIPQSEFSTVLDASTSPYERIVVAVGLYLFLRLSEISILRWRDIDEKVGSIEVFRPKTTTLDTLPLCSELHAELRRWRLDYAARMGTPVQPDWLVVPARSKPRFRGLGYRRGFEMVSEGSYLVHTSPRLNHIAADVLTRTGYYREHEGGHTLRRSGAVALYNQLSSVGHDRAIRIVQAMLGHANITTTEIYLRLDLDRKVRNDLLSGKPMFPSEGEATVIDLKERASGKENAGSVRV